MLFSPNVIEMLQKISMHLTTTLSTDDDDILLAKYQFMMTGSSLVDHIFSNYLLYRI